MTHPEAGTLWECVAEKRPAHRPRTHRETQLDRVKRLMSDGKWRTLAEIREYAGGTETAVSARLRDLRNKCGLIVASEKMASGLFRYRVKERA